MNSLRRKLVKLKSVELIPAVLTKAWAILSTKKHGKKIILVSLVQHIGDNVAAEPLTAFLRAKHPTAYIIRVVSPLCKKVIANNPHQDEFITLRSISEWIYLKAILKQFIKVYDLHVHRTFCPEYRLFLSNPNKENLNISNYLNTYNLLQVFCINAAIPPMDVKPTFHFSSEQRSSPLPAKYIAIQTTSNGLERTWHLGHWKTLINFIWERLGMKVVEVGSGTQLNLSPEMYINACELSFNETAQIISHAEIFIGIDSAFAHFANCFHIKKLILLGHYAGFVHYNPLSGMPQELQKKELIWYDGLVANLPAETVKERLLSLLNGKAASS